MNIKEVNCSDCPKYNGYDCTSHPYQEGCVKDPDNEEWLRSPDNPEHLNIETKMMKKGKERNVKLYKMSDRDKVFIGLKHCSDQMLCNDGCPYYKCGVMVSECTSYLAEDVLELLEKQEQKINELEEQLRLLKYGDQETQNGVMMPAT